MASKCGWESSRIDLAINNFIKVTELSEISNEIKQVISTNDGGEKQVISLGSVTSGELILLLDDKAGRNAAKKLGLATTGLVGVLIFPKEKGLINEVSSLLEELRIQGYWLGDSLIQVKLLECPEHLRAGTTPMNNVARGPLIDEAALVAALASGWIPTHSEGLTGSAT